MLGFGRTQFPCTALGKGPWVSFPKCWVQESLPGPESGLAESQPPEDLPSVENKATMTELSLNNSNQNK